MMPKKIALFSLLFIPILAFVMLWFIVFPALGQHNALRQSVLTLMALRQESSKIDAAIKNSSNNLKTLQASLRNNASLSFLQQALDSSHFSDSSIKINNSGVAQEVHIDMRGDYRDFLIFLGGLARYPNAFHVVRFSLQKQSFAIDVTANISTHLQAQSKQRFIKHPQSLQERLQASLRPYKPPVLVMPTTINLRDVQSPFFVRASFAPQVTSMQNLLTHDWHCVGEVRRLGRRLGVFLETKDQSEYFGIGLAWQGGDWEVVDINVTTIIFRNKHNHRREFLFYD